MKRSIVIIEDEREIAESLVHFLHSKAFEVRHYVTAEEYVGDPSAPTNCIYLVDWNLPGVKGIDIVREIRKKDKISPVFMISGYSRREEVVAGLQAGADDYITKPFNFDELGVRVENAWAKLTRLEENILQHGVKLFPDAHIVMREGVSVGLTAREYVIFTCLYARGEVASTREQIIACFGKEEKMTARNIDVHIFSLRKKIRKIDMGVETVWGTGYRLVNRAAPAVTAAPAEEQD